MRLVLPIFHPLYDKAYYSRLRQLAARHGHGFLRYVALPDDASHRALRKAPRVEDNDASVPTGKERRNSTADEYASFKLNRGAC